MGRDSSGAIRGRFKLITEGTGVGFLDGDTSTPSDIITPPPVNRRLALMGADSIAFTYQSDKGKARLMT